MEEDEIEAQRRETEHGVLALADGDDAYGVPLRFNSDGDRLPLRVREHGDDPEKHRFLGTTAFATFVCYDAPAARSWSILVRGPVRRWAGEVDESTLNEWFPPFRLFYEEVADVEFVGYEIVLDAVVGRRTVD